MVAAHRRQGQRHQHQVQLLLPEHTDAAPLPLSDRREAGGWFGAKWNWILLFFRVKSGITTAPSFFLGRSNERNSYEGNVGKQLVTACVAAPAVHYALPDGVAWCWAGIGDRVRAPPAKCELNTPSARTHSRSSRIDSLVELTFVFRVPYFHNHSRRFC